MFLHFYPSRLDKASFSLRLEHPSLWGAQQQNLDFASLPIQTNNINSRIFSSFFLFWVFFVHLRKNKEKIFQNIVERGCMKGDEEETILISHPSQSDPSPAASSTFSLTQHFPDNVLSFFQFPPLRESLLLEVGTVGFLRNSESMRISHEQRICNYLRICIYIRK